MKNLFHLYYRTATVAFLTLTSLFCIACYHDQSPGAVEKAREFALDNLRELTEVQRNYIRYTEPVIYENVIYPHYAFMPADFNHVRTELPRTLPRRQGLDYMHSCVVWSPPDLGAKVVVVGEGERSMRFWWPNRVLIKNYIPRNVPVEIASTKATEYVMSAMTHLSDSERNRIRFSEPEIILTKFDLSEDESVEASSEKSPWETYVETIESKKEPVQISLVWNADSPDKRIAICGYAPDSSALRNWVIHSGKLVAKTELDANTLTDAEKKALIEKEKIGE